MQDMFSVEHHLPASGSQCRSPSLPCSSRSSSDLPVASALPSSGGRAPLPPAVTPPGYAWLHAAPEAHAASSLAQPRKHHVPHLGTGETWQFISGDRGTCVNHVLHMETEWQFKNNKAHGMGDKCNTACHIWGWGEIKHHVSNLGTNGQVKHAKPRDRERRVNHVSNLATEGQP